MQNALTYRRTLILWDLPIVPIELAFVFHIRVMMKSKKMILTWTSIKILLLPKLPEKIKILVVIELQNCF